MSGAAGGEGVLAEPPAWEGLLRHFASPWNPSFTLSSTVCLIIFSNAQILHHGISIELLLSFRIPLSTILVKIG